MIWISVEKYLPGNKLTWVIVKCFDPHGDEEFYFMAMYSLGSWEFFDENEERERTLKITHCLDPREDKYY